MNKIDKESNLKKTDTNRFDVESNLKRINQAISYLTNAQGVYTSTVTTASNEINTAQASFFLKEREILDEKNRRLASINKDYDEAIKKEKQERDELFLVNQRLISVDKKYAKTYARMDFSGGDEEYLNALCFEIYGDKSPIKLLEKLLSCFKRDSFRYLNKPIPAVIIASTKRKDKYTKLACMVLLADRILKGNIEEYDKQRQSGIREAIEFYELRLAKLRKGMEETVSRKETERTDDVNYLLETARADLCELFNEDYYSQQSRVRATYESMQNQPNESSEFPQEIFMGDMLSYSAAFSLKNKVSAEFIKAHGKLFEENLLISPWTIDLTRTNNYFVSVGMGENSIQSRQFVNGFILSMMTQLPVNGLELSVFDPEQKGNSINPFLNLLTTMPDMFSKKIFTSSEMTVKRLQELNQYVDSIIQQKLSNKYENILEYNYATPDNPLPLKLICVFDFPKYFDSHAFESLLTVMKNGGKCGIITIICFNKLELKTNYGDAPQYLQEIKNNAICVEQSGESFLIENSTSSLFPVDLPKQEIVDQLCVKYEQISKSNLNKGIPFTALVSEQGLFSQNSAEGLSIPVGKGDGSLVQTIEIGGKSSQHAVITGATGSGKSTLLHTLIMSAILNYSPDQLNLYLMDFKSGTEFKIYETFQVPHIKLLALDALQEFGASILSELLEEQVRRSNLFKDNGDHKSIKSYVQATGKSMPRILVIMDEFQILFNESSNRKVAQLCAEMTNKIVTEGRAFGIHLIMATQTLRNIREKTTLSGSTIEQMRIRIGLKCGEEDANYIFGDSNARDALEKMKGAIGTAVYNYDYTESKNQSFRTAYCPDSEQIQLLQNIAAECQKKYPIDIKIFEGRRIPVLPVDNYIARGVLESSEVEVEVGEPIRVAPPVRLCFGKRRNANLLVVGADSKMAGKITRLVALGIVQNAQTRLFYIDGNSFFDEPSDSVILSLEGLAGSKFQRITTRSECLLMLESVGEEIKKRKRNISMDKARIFVLIDGLQCVDILCAAFKGESINRSDYIDSDNSASDDANLNMNLTKIHVDDDPFSLDVSSNPFSLDVSNNFDYGSILKEIAESGYTFGVNLIIVCNEYSTIKDVLHYGSGILSKLPSRIVFSLSDRDCDDLIDGAKVSELNSTTVLYSDGIKNVFQFKPYEITDQEQIKTILKQNII